MQEKNIERAQSKPVESTLEKGTFFDPDLKISQIDNSAQSMDVENLAQGGSEGAIVSAREQLAKIIDLPALKAVELLYDKNVQTHSSSANHLDCGGFATINICHDSLSDENKAISDGMIADGLIACSTPDDPTYRGGSKAIIIGVPVNLESSVGQISDLLENLASHFKPQDVLYGREKNVQEWLARNARPYGMDVDEFGDTIQEQIYALSPNSYYDAENNEIFACKELYEKHIEYIRQNSK